MSEEPAQHLINRIKLHHIETPLSRYDHRLRENVAKNIVDDVAGAVISTEPGSVAQSVSSAKSRPIIGKAAKQFPRVALDLATTVERIQQNFCICDPTLPDCPIVFASDSFLELTEYKREEVLGRNCRFLQGTGTDAATVQQIRDAVKSEAELTVRILNYTKSGRAFWNMFTLAPMRDAEGHARFFVGVQVDVTAQAAAPGDKPPAWSKTTSAEDAIAGSGMMAAAAIGSALVGMVPSVSPWASVTGAVMKYKPHKGNDKAYQHLMQTQQKDGKLKLAHFRRVKQLGAGDVGLVDLVQLQGTDLKFAMKTLDKLEMQERNKVQRVLTEAQILTSVDHPFLPTLYCILQVGNPS